MKFFKNWANQIYMTKGQVIYYIVIDISLGSIVSLALLGFTIYIGLSCGNLWWLMFLTLIPMIIIIIIESLVLRFLFRYYRNIKKNEKTNKSDDKQMN